MAILMLAMHPDVQERIYDEMQQFGPQQSFSYDEITGQMQYTEMVIKETMRLYPVISFVCREVTADVRLSDCTFPKGAVLMLSVLKLHRSRRFWGDDAELFDPERFSAERSATRDSYFYMPFSTGSRNCTGHRYAMISMKIILGNLVRNYRFSTNLNYADIKCEYGPLFKFLNEYDVRIERR